MTDRVLRFGLGAAFLIGAGVAGAQPAGSPSPKAPGGDAAAASPASAATAPPAPSAAPASAAAPSPPSDPAGAPAAESAPLTPRQAQLAELDAELQRIVEAAAEYEADAARLLRHPVRRRRHAGGHLPAIRPGHSGPDALASPAPAVNADGLPAEDAGVLVGLLAVGEARQHDRAQNGRCECADPAHGATGASGSAAMSGRSRS